MRSGCHAPSDVAPVTEGSQHAPNVTVQWLNRGRPGRPVAQALQVVLGGAGLLGRRHDLAEIPRGRQAALVAGEDVYPGGDVALQRGDPHGELAVRTGVDALDFVE